LDGLFLKKNPLFEGMCRNAQKRRLKLAKPLRKCDKKISEKNQSLHENRQEVFLLFRPGASMNTRQTVSLHDLKADSKPA
jgi:hypothetical protein